MIQGSVFSGIGGFDLASEWMGWENAFNCEYNPFCQRVLKYYWPYAKQYKDIRETDFSIWRNRIDVLTGGFPCQPYSTAGKRKGKEDERHLWPEMLRCVREIRPRWVVGENVRGLVSWSGGLVFEEVQADLEAEGYEVQPFVFPASGIGAPHKRERVWFVAYAGNDVHAEGLEYRRDREKTGRSEGGNQQQARPHDREWFRDESGAHGVQRLTPDPHHSGNSTSGNRTNPNRQAQSKERKREPQRMPCRHGSKRPAPNSTGQGLPFGFEAGNGGAPGAPPKRKELERNASTRDWSEFPTQPPVLPGDDGLPAPVAGYSVSGWRKEFIAGPGNAIVPQLAYKIFQAIEAYEKIISPNQ